MFQKNWAVTLLFVAFFAPSTAFSKGWLIKSVKVLDVETGAFSDPKDVLVTDQKIQNIADSLNSSLTTIIDGSGKYLVPGFTEMHAHIPPQRVSDEERDKLLFLYSAYGITTIRGMLGHPLHLPLREQLANNKIDGPRLITSGPSFNGNSISSVKQAKGRVNAQIEKGYDFIKVHPGMTDDEYTVMAKVASESNFDYSGHVTAQTGIVKSAKLGQGTVDHLDGVIQELAKRSGNSDYSNAGFFGSNIADLVDEKHIVPLATELAQMGIAMVPTESLMHGFTSPESPEVSARRAEVKLMPQATVNGWIRTRKSIHTSEGYSEEKVARFLQVRNQFIAAFNKAGGTVLLGSDAPQVFNVPGDSIHFEMELMVNAGMTPLQVLQAASIKPAQFFNRATEFGSIEEGKSADFVLLTKNPLEDIKNTRSIEGVMTRGVWLSKQEIKEGLDRIRR